jgi:hypothetical protein
MSQGPAPFPQGISGPRLFLNPVPFSSLPAGSKAGWQALISDSDVTVPGAVISGGGTASVLGWYDGAAWRVAGGVAQGGSAPNQYTAITGTSWTAADIAGASYVVLATSGATALTTPTAAQIIAAVPGWEIGDSYRLRVYNTNGGTLTLTGGTGVTITGTATIATAVWREYIVSYSAAAAVAMQNIGAGDAT